MGLSIDNFHGEARCNRRWRVRTVRETPTRAILFCRLVRSPDISRCNAVGSGGQEKTNGPWKLALETCHTSVRHAPQPQGFQAAGRRILDPWNSSLMGDEHYKVPRWKNCLSRKASTDASISPRILVQQRHYRRQGPFLNSSRGEANTASLAAIFGRKAPKIQARSGAGARTCGLEESIFPLTSDLFSGKVVLASDATKVGRGGKISRRYHFLLISKSGLRGKEISRR